MEQVVIELQNLLKTNNIDMKNKNLKKIISKIEIFFYWNINQIQKDIFKHKNDTKVMIIDECTENNNNNKYIIVCFDYNVIIIQGDYKAKITNLNDIFSNVKDYKQYFIKNIKNSTDDHEDRNFWQEIQNFSKECTIQNKKQDIKFIWNMIIYCLSGFLIKKGYQNSRNKQKNYFNEEFKEHREKYESSNKSYIKLRRIDHGSGGEVSLIYYISTEEVYALKTPFDDLLYLNEREWINYQNIKFPFIVHYFGYIEDNKRKYLLLEYVEGKTLYDFDLAKLTSTEKCIIILELLITIRHLHSQGYIYRDLKLDNIIINESHEAILIDFDRLIKNDEMQEEETKYFNNPASAPETHKTYQSDIYSLGYLIHYILYSEFPVINNEKTQVRSNFIFESCLNKNPNKRPTINELIYMFLIDLLLNNESNYLTVTKLLLFFGFQIPDINTAIHYYSLAANQNHPQAQFNLGVIYHEGKYVTRDINKAIHYYSLAANQNLPQAQINLGVIYSEGKYVTRDINKAIHYYSLAANQNLPQAQFNLGLIYHEGKYVTRDINKAIHYYSLAANQNYPEAQFNLGLIYDKGKYVTRDINKAIHYYSLAANQNDPQAQFNLGLIYHEGKYVTCDINKAIHYYSLAANQNIPQAQFNLGVIYYEGKYVTRNINKAIHYYSLAANQNIPQAQFNLGVIYHEGKYVTRDINKAIHYYLLAANQNYPQAQFNLGLIYSEGKYVTRDIDKAIHYFSLAANQNIPQAQINLGVIYHEGKYATRDINKVIHYYSLAANQNHPKAQFNLGVIYHEGKYVTRDINKAIHYYSLAANQNHPKAQFNLGVIYSEGKYVTRDINKAIHYYSLAANQNHPQAQFNLGLIYHEGKYVTRDINKAIHYYSLAANQNYPEAQINLGLIYHEDKYVTRDIDKAIHYYSLAANQSIPQAQFILGFIYYDSELIEKNIKKGRYYIMLASKNNLRIANFAHGFLLHEGKNIERNIEEAIHYYKEASSFNIQYAKNNLGIIYKHGYNGIKGRAGNAIVYFEEAIRQTNDYLSMYNLAHIYVYDDTIRGDINKAIELLIRSSNEFKHSFCLLCLVLYKQGTSDGRAVSELFEKLAIKDNVLALKISQVISELRLFKEIDHLYDSYRHKDFIYNIYFQPVLTSKLDKIKFNEIKPKYPNIKDITSKFYEGFGLDLLDR